MIQEREMEVLSMLSRSGVDSLEEKRILEIGCGTGYWLRALLQWGSDAENIFGIDLLPGRIELARKICPQGVRLECGSAAKLSFPDASFDLVLQSTVFSSILDPEMKQRAAAEMLRVTKPDGFVLLVRLSREQPEQSECSRNPQKRDFPALSRLSDSHSANHAGSSDWTVRRTFLAAVVHTALKNQDSMHTLPKLDREEVKDAFDGLHVPFHRAAVGEEEAQAVSEVIRSGWLTMGPKTFEFENKFAEYVGARHAIAVSTGTAALHLSLEAAGVQAGDEVLLPTTTFTATAEAVTYLRAKPVLVDIDPVTMNMDPEDAARRITPKTKAIIPVHLGGQPCDMEEIAKLAQAGNLRIIEDAAHALPSEYRGKRIGQISEFTCFSFYATKTLTTGEGGMITTDLPAAADRMRLMRLHGIERDAWKRYRGDGSWCYEVHEAGFKYNLTDLQSAMGLVQLAKSDSMRESRQAIAKKYSDAFSPFEELVVPAVKPDRSTSWHLYILRLRLDLLNADRDQFIDALRRQGIGCSVHFIPLHLHPYYQRAYGYRSGAFPRAEQEYRRCLSLPIDPGMTEQEMDRVIAAVKQTTAKFRAFRQIVIGACSND